MRVRIAGPTKARRGQTVSFTLSLRKDMRSAFCEIFSGANGHSPSPYIPLAKMSMIAGKPAMMAATTFRLSEAKPERTFNAVADEDCHFYIMQDVDVKGDPLIRGRIKVHGKFATFIADAKRWFNRNR